MNAEMKCDSCGAQFNFYDPLRHKAPPKINDVLVCGHCRAWYVLSARGLQPYEPQPSEIAELSLKYEASRQRFVKRSGRMN